MDTVAYKNLIPGQEYTVKGVLVSKADGSEIIDAEGEPVTAEQTFTAETADGEVPIIFAVDASVLQGETVVAFEKLYHKDIEVAAHADIEDRDQTICYPGVTTAARDGDTQGHTDTVAEKATVIDAVTCANLIEGRTYSVKGVLMVRPVADGEEALPLLDASGEPVTAERTFTVIGGKAAVEDEEPLEVPEAEEGGDAAAYAEGDAVPSLVVELVFEVDSTALEGKTIVAFEELYDGDVKVTSHADINDEAQTVTITPPPSPKTGDDSGMGLWLGLAGGAAAIAVLIVLFARRKRR